MIMQDFYVNFLLDALQNINTWLFPMPVPVLLYGIASIIALVVFFFPRQSKLLNALVKAWLGFGLFLVTVLMMNVALLLLEIPQMYSTAIPVFGGSVFYFFVGLLFFIDIPRDRINFTINSGQFNAWSFGALVISLSATLLYPIAQLLVGLTYPRIVVYGAEIPVISFTIAMLVAAMPQTSKWLLGVLSIIGILAGLPVVISGFMPDAVYCEAGFMGLVALWIVFRNQRALLPRSSVQDSGS